MSLLCALPFFLLGRLCCEVGLLWDRGNAPSPEVLGGIVDALFRLDAPLPENLAKMGRRRVRTACAIGIPRRMRRDLYRLFRRGQERWLRQRAEAERLRGAWR